MKYENQITCGDSLEVLKTFESEIVDCCITSPPYWGLRDYGVDGQLGLEKTPEEYVAKMVEIFREVKRVLKKEGTVWLNLGDSYNGLKVGNTETNKNPNAVTSSFRKEKSVNLKEKDLVGIPWRVAFALQADGWYLRQDIIWAKPNPMPESVTDRCTKSHEYVFLLTKSPKYYFDNEAIQESLADATVKRGNQGVWESKGGKLADGVIGMTPKSFDNAVKVMLEKGTRNKRSVWTVTTKPYSEAHFATFPYDLIAPMIKAGSPDKGIVLDPFMGSGTTAWTARSLGRNYVGIELNPAYIKLAEKRLSQQVLAF